MRADEKRSWGRFLYNLTTREADRINAINQCLEWVSEVCRYVGENAKNSNVPISDEELGLLALVSKGCGSVRLRNGDDLNATARSNRFKSGSVQLRNGDNSDFGSVLVDPETTFGLLQPRGSIFGGLVMTTCVGASLLAYDNDNRRRYIVVIGARWSPYVGQGRVFLDGCMYPDVDSTGYNYKDFRMQIWHVPYGFRSENDVRKALNLPPNAGVTVHPGQGMVILPWDASPRGGRRFYRVGKKTNDNNGKKDKNEVGVAGVVYVCNPVSDSLQRRVGRRGTLGH